MRLGVGWHRSRPLVADLVLALIGVLLMAALSMIAHAQDKPPRQSPREADQAMRELMQKRTAVRGVTTRGLSVTQAPPFKVVPRKPALTKYPCLSCHDNSFVDPRVRQLKDEHTDLKFDHGGGRFWCYDACHNGRDMNNLVSIKRRPIDYDQPYLLCGQCHFEKQKDWSFGGHGRRAGAWTVPREVPATHDQLRVVERDKIGTWKGERTLLACPACHNVHSPSIKPYTPSPAPLVRAGLTRSPTEPESHTRPWEPRAPKASKP
jgi:hypothetical protein